LNCFRKRGFYRPDNQLSDGGYIANREIREEHLNDKEFDENFMNWFNIDDNVLTAKMTDDDYVLSVQKSKEAETQVLLDEDENDIGQADAPAPRAMEGHNALHVIRARL
jgi:hypothetical protein